MLELFRDTSIGHLLRWLSGGKILPHAEDVDPSLWRMYISTEKSATLEHLVLEKNRRRKRTKGKRLQERTEKPTSAAGAENEKSEADQQATTVKPESDAVWKPAVATNKLPSPSQALKETGQQEEKPDSTSEIDKSPSPPGGNLGTAGTWNNDEIQQTYADDRSPQSWSNPDTPHNRSNAANTPLDTSSTELLWTAKDTGTTTTPENGKLDQGYVTAAMGQEGMDVSMQQGQVDGDPALLLHSENNETTWNTVQLEAGEQDGPTAKEGTAHAVDPAAERVVNVVVWLGPQDPGVRSPPLWSML